MVISRLRAAVVVLLLAALLPLSIGQPEAAAQGQADYLDEFVAGGFGQGVSLDWMNDGRAIVIGKWGQLYVADPSNGTQYSYMYIGGDIDSTGERGLLDVAVDKNFASNKFYYVYYSDNSSRLTIARYKFTGNGSNDRASKVVLWQNPGPLHSSYGLYHVGGSLNIGNDGKFYLSVGDGFQPQNSGQLTNVFGKILRINLNGSVPTDNPFYDGTGPNIDEIWAYGLRNPFRASVDSATGRYFIGDVGGNDAPTAYEEVNLGQRGRNYGWPACEGPLDGPKNGPTCPSGVTAPVLYYGHDPAGSCCQNAAITGGEIFRSNQLPSSLNGAYIYGDYAQNEIRYATFNGDGTLAQDGVLKSIPNKQPVWIGQGPDGYIYYVHFSYSGSTGELRRIRYTGASSSPPVITQAQASPTSGEAPLAVNFSGSATDADGDAIAYRWTFGDGTTSNSRNPSHTYNSAGNYSAQLTVTAGGQSTSSASITISVGQAPTVNITSPSNGSTFVAGQTINLTGNATDDGPLTSSSYKWDISFVHDNHIHPAMSGLSGTSRTFTVPTSGHDFSGDTSYLISLTVTDSDGTETVKTVEIEPAKRSINVGTSPSTISTIKVDGITRNTPFTLDTVQGFVHSLEALSPVCVGTTNYGWDRWNIGGSRARTYTVPAANQTVTAFYTTSGSCGTVPDTSAPTVAWSAPFASRTASAPASVTGAVNLVGTATDNQAIDRVIVRIDNLANGQYWNETTKAWQTSPKWNVVAQPRSGTSLNWSDSFNLADGTYRSYAISYDMSGNRSSIPATYFNVTSPVDPGNDTTIPVVSWSAPFAGRTISSPASVSSPVNLVGTATDNVGIDRVIVRIDNLDTGLYWNNSTGAWQSSPSWTVVTRPQGGTSHNWSKSFAIGNGSFRSYTYTYDLAGNRNAGAPVTFFTIGGSTGTTTTTSSTTSTSTTTTTTTTQPPSGNDTTRPTHAYNYPYAGSTQASPAEVGANVVLSGTATDNVALSRVRIQIRDLGTGRYWNPRNNKWQKKGSWNTVATSSNGAKNLNWSYSFTPRGGTGVYHVAVEVTDAAGNKMSPNMLAYFNTP